MLKGLFLTIITSVSLVLVGCGVNGAGALPSPSASASSNTIPGVDVTSINTGVAFEAADEPPIVSDGSGGLVRQPLSGVTYTTTTTTTSVFTGTANK